MDRNTRDRLFTSGMYLMAQGNYEVGLKQLRSAAGADHLEYLRPGTKYTPLQGIAPSTPMKQAVNDRHPGRVIKIDPAALVFLGAEAEFKGTVERRAGSSPDYRVDGYANHFGDAINYYRRASRLGYEVGLERLEALQRRIGAVEFQAAWQQHAADDAARKGRMIGVLDVLDAQRTDDSTGNNDLAAEVRVQAEYALYQARHELRQAEAMALEPSRMDVVSPRSPDGPKVVVHGATQPSIANPEIQIFWNGDLIGTMKSLGGKFEFPITSDGELTLKCVFG